MTVKKVGISINGKRIEKYFKTYLDGLRWRHKMIEKYSDPSLPNESWNPMPGFKRYQASDAGRLRSLNYKRSGLIKIIKPAIDKKGYLCTMLQNDQGKYNSWTVHKWIALTFHGPCPKGKEVNHKDGNKLNNKPDNLEYCTHKQNCQHAVDNGLWEIRVGELNGMAKLTNEQVLRAREMKRTKGRFWGRNELAKEYGISAKHLQKIVNNPDVSWYNV